MLSNGTGVAKLLVLSAPSGAGKSTLAKMLLEKYPEKFCLSISATTRAPRAGELEGVHYFFKTEKNFLEMVQQKAFLEYAHVFNKYWYGTPRDFVEKSLSAGHHVVFDIDVQGAKSIKPIYGSRCLGVFIHPPSIEELEKRLRTRQTETEDAIQRRLATAKQEINASPFFDAQITNVDLQKTFYELEDLLRREGFLA